MKIYLFSLVLIGCILINGEAESKCLPIPNLLGKIQKTDTGTNILYEYSCSECSACLVNDKPGCWDSKTGNCILDEENRTSVDYRDVVIKRKQLCGSIDEGLSQSLKNREYIVFPPEVIEDEDIFLSAGGCGTPNPREISLYNKNGELKYAHIKHIIGYLGGKEEATQKTINGITILPHKKNKINCDGPEGMCVYSAEFRINGRKIVLEPNRIFKGENFILKYLGSNFAKDRIEDYSGYFDYEIYFGDAQTKIAAE